VVVVVRDDGVPLLLGGGEQGVELLSRYGALLVDGVKELLGHGHLLVLVHEHLPLLGDAHGFH
jgi:hypothetical protein